MTARSRSGRSQPTGRPDSGARGPLTKSVQSVPLSSRQAPSAPFFTIKLTGGGGGLAGFSGGSKPPPALGGGFTPPYGPPGLLTTLGGKLPPRPPPRAVEPFPDAKIAT